MHETLRDCPFDECLMILSQIEAAIKPDVARIIPGNLVLAGGDIPLISAQVSTTMTCALVAT